MDDKINKKIQEWLSESYDENTRAEIQKLLNDKNETEIIDRFYKDLDFGTGGLRGVLGAGTNRMNIYTVGMSAQGLANYLLKSRPASREMAAVIAYDSRQLSDVFSLRSARILAANGIKAYVFKTLHPTPILSFAIRHLGAAAGIMVTASHNPPEYNGYKVYYSDGAQVLPPHDEGIIREVRSIASVSDVKIISEEEALSKGLLEYVEEEIDEAYYERVLGLRVNPEIISESDIELKVVYSPLHGTGSAPVKELLSRAGYRDLELVPEQEKPDGMFPTVKYPNPEESEALELAINQAKRGGCDLVLATDPDADRVGIAVNNGVGEFILLNGNQVGSLLCYYLLSQWKEKNSLPKKPFMVKTIVSTDLPDRICEEFNVELDEVLTGFKYIAQKVYQHHDVEGGSRDFLYGFEESYGYNLGDFVRDKDAVSACLMISEMAAYCKKQGKTLLNYLDEVYERYGYYIESLKSLTLKGKEGVENIAKIMDQFRNKAPESIAGSKVVKIRDVKLSRITDVQKGVQEKIDLPVSNVITFYLKNSGKVTLRPSGTEPKIKFYFSFALRDSDRELEAVKSAANKELQKLEEDFLAMVQGIIG